MCHKYLLQISLKYCSKVCTVDMQKQITSLSGLFHRLTKVPQLSLCAHFLGHNLVAAVDIKYRSICRGLHALLVLLDMLRFHYLTKKDMQQHIHQGSNH